MIDFKIADSLDTLEEKLLPKDDDEISSQKSDGAIESEEYIGVTREVTPIWSSFDNLNGIDIHFKEIDLGKEFPSNEKLNEKPDKHIYIIFIYLFN